ncbi:phosphatidylinositol-specific phospholipase C/glycerophosphodiester phosphodiesterase family protein [uncultured Fibrella sp.]|uniref:phosphatidylinositol-specific phospholipase C/glycerophosphodiester phosphodiesterase family protein n=1 Tax=uncultured Fibrella sp. TaxID=1284596 RepID=UPI0035CA381C
MIRLICFFCFLSHCAAAQQVFAHNDYEKPQPLTQALAAKADFIEADIYLRNGKLVVAHMPQEADTATRTLENLYLMPIVALFETNKGRISTDRRYAPSLVFDIKDKIEDVLPKLLPLLENNLVAFSRSVSPMAVRIIITGNRPRPEFYLDQPTYLFFDGRPSELYDEETAKRVALISDNFRSYARWDGTGDIPEDDKAKLKRIIKRAHDTGCPMRFWNAPDTPNAWKKLYKLGIDVINTDKVAECVAAIK